MTVKLSTSSTNAKQIAALKAKAFTPKKNKNKVDDKSQNYTQTETMGFLRLMEEIKPIGSEEWDLLIREDMLKRSRLDAISTLSEENMPVVTGSPIQLVTHTVQKKSGLLSALNI